jgi:hypothetical protein
MAAVDLSPHIAPHGSGVIREGNVNIPQTFLLCVTDRLLRVLRWIVVRRLVSLLLRRLLGDHGDV